MYIYALSCGKTYRNIRPLSYCVYNSGEEDREENGGDHAAEWLQWHAEGVQRHANDRPQQLLQHRGTGIWYLTYRAAMSSVTLCRNDGENLRLKIEFF